MVRRVKYAGSRETPSVACRVYLRAWNTCTNMIEMHMHQSMSEPDHMVSVGVEGVKGLGLVSDSSDLCERAQRCCCSCAV